MSINITNFANAVISVSPTSESTGNFGILGMLTNEVKLEHTERTRAYTDLPGVASDWNSNTEVYKAATAFYSQTPQPKDFVVLSVYDVNQAAILLSGLTDTVSQLSVLGATSFSIEVGPSGSSTVFLVSFDLTGLTSYSAIASAINTALTTASSGVTCSHNGYSFVLKTISTGASSVLNFATGAASDNLGLSQAFGTLSQGFVAETRVDALSAASSKGMEFIGLVTHKSFRDDVSSSTGNKTEDIADWCEGNKKIFCNTTNNLTSLTSSVTTDIGSVLRLKGNRYTITSFAKNANQYVSASLFGRAASVNFEGIGSTITLNLKQMPTITAEVLTSSEYGALLGKNINAVVTIGKTSRGYTNSKMASGAWLDSVHGLLWLENRIETDIFNLLYTTNTKIPYTQTGINLVIATLERSLLAAVKNGLAGPGYLPDGSFLPTGFIVLSVPLAQVVASDKSNRLYRGLSFKMVGAGALHEVLVSGEFSE